MAIRAEGFDDMLRKLERLSDRGKVEEIAKKAVSAAEPKLLESTKSAVAAAEQGPYSTGSVSASVSATGAKVNEYGVYTVARPTGRDNKGVRNAQKAAMLEYGVPGHLNPRPWRAKAAGTVEDACVKTMEDVLKAEMGADS